MPPPEMVHRYFIQQQSEEWNIESFLNEFNDEAELKRKMDLYLKSLEVIERYGKGKKQRKAGLLLNKYREASK
jgi:hypothetical protein